MNRRGTDRRGMPLGPGLIVPSRHEAARKNVREVTSLIGEFAERCGGMTRVHFANGEYLNFTTPVAINVLEASVSQVVEVAAIDPHKQIVNLRRQVIE